MMALGKQKHTKAATINGGEKYFTGNIPIHLVGSHTLKSEYICKCVEEDLYSTTLSAAVERFGKSNIIQIHRDLPGSLTSSYRKLLAEKLNWPKDDFLAAQVEFYIPLPEKLAEVKEKLAQTTAV